VRRSDKRIRRDVPNRRESWCDGLVLDLGLRGSVPFEVELAGRAVERLVIVERSLVRVIKGKKA
jgi:hypothetical protein